MRPSYLGRILLHWCDTCHVPVLSHRCACGGDTREVPVTPPGDARPAFPRDIAWINTVYQDHFGAPLIPKGHLCLLNKVPDNDRMDEIVVGGGIAGSLRYIPEKRKYEPIPRPEAGLLFRPAKRYVVIDDGAVPYVRDGASVLAPGLLEIDDAVDAGDEVLILSRDGTCIGAGRAKVSADVARSMEKGQVIRVRKNIPSQIVPAPATWEDAVSSNSEVLRKAEEDSVNFVVNVKDNYSFQPSVSFSGGKDSLATLLVVRKALGKIPLLFADTGMEFPETYENIRTVSREFDLDVIATDGPNQFWEQFQQRGPPAVNARWCCKACKLDPLSSLIREKWGECLSFVGQRKYESQTRAQSRRVWKNPNVPPQLCAAPIHNWTALHVWLYIMREHAPYNSLYEQGLDRIGCFMCPASDMALIHRIESDHPSLWTGWMEQLVRWQKQQGLPDNWASSGKWRIRQKVREGSFNEDDSDC